jgi:hypothetical protein
MGNAFGNLESPDGKLSVVLLTVKMATLRCACNLTGWSDRIYFVRGNNLALTTARGVMDPRGHFNVRFSTARWTQNSEIVSLANLTNYWHK